MLTTIPPGDRDMARRKGAGIVERTASKIKTRRQTQQEKLDKMFPKLKLKPKKKAVRKR